MIVLLWSQPYSMFILLNNLITQQTQGQCLIFTLWGTLGNRTRHLCDYLDYVLISWNCIYWQTARRELLRKRWARKAKTPTIKPFQICQDSSSHRTADNLSCLAASNTVKAWSRCLSQCWFPRQQEYDNVAIDMTEGIISLTNRDNRHREGWGKGREGGLN